MPIVQSIKEVYWSDLAKKDGRFQYLNAFLGSIPGTLGCKLRSRFIPRYFERAGANTYIDRRVRFYGARHLSVGDNVAFAEDDFIQAQGGITIGDGTIFGPGVKIWTTTHEFSSLETPIAQQGIKKDPVTIGRDNWIGANVFIMPGVTIPDGCVVSAGAVVGVKQYKPYSIIAGNPARVIGTRKPQAEQFSPPKGD